MGAPTLQNEIVQPQRLLDENGQLIEKGYATRLLLEYNRKHIKARTYRIKEWDYYLIANDEYALALTIADNSYMGLVSVSLLDFEQPWYKTTSVMKLFTFGKLGLPSSSEIGNLIYKDKRVQMSFLNDGNSRKLSCQMSNFDQGKAIDCELELYDEPSDSIVIATPFAEDSQAFYYNQKINNMKARGKVLYNGREYTFDPETSTGTLDWGRGVWTYSNVWYWGSASGFLHGKRFGFNIGYGFGDTSAASENMLFYDGKAHKLDGVTFHIPKSGNTYQYSEPWKFTSNDQRFEMNFIPILDRSDFTSIGLISSDQHQVFGRFTGTAILDDGTNIEVNNLLGFAERVANRW